MKIGDFERGEEVTIGLTLTRDDLYFREAQFLCCDHEAISRDLGELQARNAGTTAVKVSNTELKITVNAAEDSLLFTTVPAEKGWTVTLDGQEAETVELLDALIGVPVSAGRHTVSMKFVTAGYPSALLITAEGLALFIGMILVSVYLKKKSRQKAEDGENPELESALSEWESALTEAVERLPVSPPPPGEETEDGGPEKR